MQKKFAKYRYGDFNLNHNIFRSNPSVTTNDRHIKTLFGKIGSIQSTFHSFYSSLKNLQAYNSSSKYI